MSSLRSRALVALIVALPVAARVSPAQPKAAAGSPSRPAARAAQAAEDSKAAAPAADTAAADPLAQIVWQAGPATAALGGVVHVNVPDRCRLTDAAGAALFTQGGPDAARGDEIGVVLCASARPDGGHWYAVLRYTSSGRVSDQDRDSLDADAILAAMRAESTADTEARRKRGEPALPLVGWARPPAYDASSFMMSWATLYANGNPADETVVHSARLLGREGVLRADLVVAPDDYATELPAFEAFVRGVSFTQGKHYADWKEGDAVAGYGLAALATGATITVAQAAGILAVWIVVKAVLFKVKLVAKKIILVVLAKFGKLLFVALAGLGVLLRTWWQKRRAAAA